MKTLLVANRGEIATRIFTTARRMGLGTVAVYADPDVELPFVRHADVAVRLPGSTATETYLRIDLLLDAAARTGADAVHPGYGFLAENAAFARAVVDVGLTWVGPPPDVIAAMGDKIEAKRIAADAGVPLLPSAVLEGDDPSMWSAAVDGAEIGYPLLVKAAAGGGGRGMREVESAGELEAAVVSARREAESAFGDGTVFAERLVRGGRHVEVQVFGDTHGNVIHLGERECSIQRRHQKIIEEAPSPGITDGVRTLLLKAGLALAQHIGYVNAGTVEFLVDGQGDEAHFYFLEMNTRLQVEHRVTEWIHRQDLVELQLQVAAGDPLPVDDLAEPPHGCAIEVRLYAEDPAHDFAPSFGPLHAFFLSTPTADETVERGSVVTTAFDPLLAKVWRGGEHRDLVVEGLIDTLASSEIAGVSTNRDLLMSVLAHEAFRSADTTVDFLERFPEVVEPRVSTELRELHALAVATCRAEIRCRDSRWPFVPARWRNVPRRSDDEATRVLNLHPWSDEFGERWDITLEHGGLATTATVSLYGDPEGANTVVVSTAAGTTEWIEEDRFPDPEAHGGAGGGPIAPVPGTIVSVEVSVGETVEAGQTLVVLEAMKMEHRIEAHGPGTVEAVLVAPGDRVDAHQLLVRIA